MAEMNLARTMGVVVGFLAVLTYEHVISVRLAVLVERRKYSRGEVCRQRVSGRIPTGFLEQAERR
jgi:hypothetical protein